ncbi:putative E3 ubiquitin-protein ligase HECTD2 [Pseudocercospora fuligena]|uniref:HECT-type E3 ubiquitin transferase n=1 Tax=Pseudocercospora fuligena TaxID=685502 RepID=A0A8H6RHQ2_9PEZI|nr:putative E3 ubiquitin-protein ligase HECTD2 [Pseudocercospora fuligena]
MASEVLDNNAQTGDKFTRPPANAVTDIEALVPRYVDQLLNGCKDSTCEEQLCHSGRLNTSNKPVRKYTPRSARAIALTICSGPQPERFLCSHCNGQANDSNGPIPPSSATQEGEHDASSLSQLLCNTESIRAIRSLYFSRATELRSLHHNLAKALQHAGGKSARERGLLLSNPELVELLVPCVDHLIAKFPAQRTAVWEMIDHDIISRGRAFPQKAETRPADDKYNTWLTTLDVLDNEPYLSLLQSIVKVICVRLELEHSVYAARARIGSIKGAGLNAKNGIASMFASAFARSQVGSPNAIYALVVWLKKLFAREWDSRSTLYVGSVCHGVLEIFTALHRRCQSSKARENMFTMPLVRGRLTEVELAQPYVECMSKEIVHICRYGFIFPVEQLFLSFKTVNHLTMRQAHSHSVKAVGLRQKIQSGGIMDLNKLPSQVLHSEEHYFLVSVARTNVLQDTFDQLWQRRKSELRRPLRVRLGQTDELEVGHDLGGVQIEFFNLVCREILNEDLQMFNTDSKTGLSYFQPCSLQPLHMFNLFGVLFALAVYNGITLPIRLPQIFYHILLSPSSPSDAVAELGIEALQDGWSTMARSLKSIMDGEFYGLDFELPLEANGLRLSVLPPQKHEKGQRDSDLKVVDATPIIHHAGSVRSFDETRATLDTSLNLEQLSQGFPGWNVTKKAEEPMAVTSENKDDYVNTYVNWLCYTSVRPQFDALLKGFHETQLFPEGALSILGPSLLKSYIEGTDTFDLNDLKAATRYDGYDAKSKYIQTFWRVVAAWPEEKQKQLLKFVTAAERIPITGVKNLVFIIKKANVENLENLPTSSTCFGTLMLPRYASADILREKLGLALKFGTEGFGTG